MTGLDRETLVSKRKSLTKKWSVLLQIIIPNDSLFNKKLSALPFIFFSEKNITKKFTFSKDRYLFLGSLRNVDFGML